MQPIALFMLALCLAACGRMAPTPEPAPQPPAPPAPASQAGGGNFQGEIKTLPEPNHYQVDLKWEAPASGRGWWITRHGGVRPETFAVRDPDVRMFIDEAPTPGESYEYTLTSDSPTDTPLRLSTKIKIPHDREIVASEETDDILGVNRLFWRKGAELRPRGEKLTISVHSLIAEPGARLRALPVEAAALGANGRTAPLLHLKAATAMGELEVITDGREGGLGVSGGSGATGRPGGRGSDSQLRRQPSRDTDRTFCDLDASDGGRGGNGGPGFPGGAGGRGGDTAPVYFRIDHAPNFRVNAHGAPGAGGIGGNGGPGGGGGLGGAPGRTISPCYGVARSGQNGNPGSAGAPGPKGIEGRTSYTCLKLGESVFGGCPSTVPEPDWDKS